MAFRCFIGGRASLAPTGRITAVDVIFAQDGTSM